jgi:predicted TIM-barrel fold metal-dependent hydrolase
MSTQTTKTKPELLGIGEGIIDSDIHPAPVHGTETMKSYIPQKWRDHIDTYGDSQNGPYATTYAFPRYMPGTARRDAWPEGGGDPGSSLELMRAQHLDPNNVALGILEPLGFGLASRNIELCTTMCSAFNDWQLETFTEHDSRLRASIMVPADDAVAAVAEIRKRAPDKSYAQILLHSITAEPLGRPRYWPIYEEAAAHDIPIGIHVGGPSGARTAGGWPSYYNEEHLSLVSTLQTHMISLVMEGVCERFPNLRFILIEGGVLWSLSLRTRLDRIWKTMGSETPFLKKPPSEYVKSHFYLSTQPVEEPERPNDLPKLFDQVGWDRILYASDYPHWDYDDPKYAFKCEMPDDGMAKIMRSNALDLYRLG